MKVMIVLLSSLLLGAAAPGAAAQIKAVYHLSAGAEQAGLALQNIRNHLEADPKAAITVVTLATGVDFLMEGAKTARGNEYRGMVEDLDLQGVKFRVCEITLRERGLRKEQFLPEVRFVSSGVAEIARLQAREAHAYIRP